MPPDLRLAHSSVTATTGEWVDVSVQPEGRYHKGRVPRWRGGVYNTELPDAEVVKFLQVLPAHYALPEAGGHSWLSSAAVAYPFYGPLSELVDERDSSELGAPGETPGVEPLKVGEGFTANPEPSPETGRCRDWTGGT